MILEHSFSIQIVYSHCYSRTHVLFPGSGNPILAYEHSFSMQNSLWPSWTLKLSCVQQLGVNYKFLCTIHRNIGIFIFKNWLQETKGHTAVCVELLRHLKDIYFWEHFYFLYLFSCFLSAIHETILFVLDHK